MQETNQKTQRVYRHLLILLTLLQVFTFTIKITYGVANSFFLALMPTIYLGVIFSGIYLLRLTGQIRCRFSLLDVIVLSFMVLDFIQVFNPYLAALTDQRSLIIGLRGFWQRSFMGLVYFVVRWLDIKSVRFNTIIRIFAYSTAVGSLYAIVQQLYLFDSLETAYRAEQIAQDLSMQGLYNLRATGFLGSPYTFGLMCATGFVSGIYLLTCGIYSKKEKLICIASVLFNGAGIILSGSRSTYFALIVMCVFMVLIMRLSLFSAVFHSLNSIIVVIVALSLVFIIYPDFRPVQYSLDRLKTIAQVFVPDSAITDSNFITRQELNIAGLSMIIENPFGYGSGIFNGGSNPDREVTVHGYSTFMDNEFIGLTLELGVIGVLLFLTILGVALQRCHRALGEPTLRNQARILAALVLIAPLSGVGGQWLAEYPVNIIFWVVLGLIADLPLPIRTARYSLSV
jgi:hypothetical protein